MIPAVFISLDGIDGTGKSTQCQLLADYLRERGIAVTLCADPGGTEFGTKIRELLLFGREQAMGLRAEALLFMASRAELVDRVIRPALARGEIVISDRFTLANVVYQGHAGGIAPHDLWAVGRVASDGLQPDLTIVLDLTVPQAQTRRGRSADRVERRGDEYQQRVRAGFLQEANARPDRMVVIDASGQIDEVQADIRQAVSRLLGNSLEEV